MGIIVIFIIIGVVIFIIIGVVSIIIIDVAPVARRFCQNVLVAPS